MVKIVDLGCLFLKNSWVRIPPSAPDAPPVIFVYDILNLHNVFILLLDAGHNLIDSITIDWGMLLCFAKEG